MLNSFHTSIVFHRQTQTLETHKTERDLISAEFLKAICIKNKKSMLGLELKELTTHRLLQIKNMFSLVFHSVLFNFLHNCCNVTFVYILKLDESV